MSLVLSRQWACARRYWRYWPHLFNNLPSPPRLLHRYQKSPLLGDRGTWVWTTYPQSLRSSVRSWIESAASWPQVRCLTVAPSGHRAIGKIKRSSIAEVKFDIISSQCTIFRMPFFASFTCVYIDCLHIFAFVKVKSAMHAVTAVCVCLTQNVRRTASIAGSTTDNCAALPTDARRITTTTPGPALVRTNRQLFHIICWFKCRAGDTNGMVLTL